jgi:hypothetical protein
MFSSSKRANIISFKPSSSEGPPADAAPPAIDVWSYEFLFNLPTDQASDPK